MDLLSCRSGMGNGTTWVPIVPVPTTAVKRPNCPWRFYDGSPLTTRSRPGALRSALRGTTHSGESTRGSPVSEMERDASVHCADSRRASLRRDGHDASAEPRPVHRLVLGGAR